MANSFTMGNGHCSPTPRSLTMAQQQITIRPLEKKETTSHSQGDSN